MATLDDDGYGHFNLSEFTEEDFAHIDAALQIEEEHNKQGGPTITIEVAQSAIDIVSKPLSSDLPESKAEISPYRRYRRKKTLSVTDLVSPAWCEVQFDYGLRQKRFRNIDQRPASFVSGKGKEIVVEQKVAVQNDSRTKRGKSVHEDLEREIWPTGVDVDITTDEECWALRLVNMLSGLDCLMTLGYTREMPVFGVLHDKVIIGVIDEVSRRQTPQADTPVASKRTLEILNAPSTSKLIRTSSSHPQSAMFLPSASNESESMPMMDIRPLTPLRQQHPYTIHLLDTKTRSSARLPSHEDTISSRLQLMLYHRLLTHLISTSQPFDFSSLWARLDLNARKPFSERFMLQAGLIMDSSCSLAPSCLDDLARVWVHAASQLDAGGVDRTLQILYRTRPAATRGRKGKAKGSAQEVVGGHEAEEIAKAIEESLKDISGDCLEDEMLARALAESLEDLPQEAELSESDLGTPAQSVKDGILISGKVQAHTEPENFVGESHSAADDIHVSKIIGTKEFTVDDPFLDSYLVDVLQWWDGVRPPRGVDVAQTGRCFTCEYRNGCEWREAKAMEKKMVAC